MGENELLALAGRVERLEVTCRRLGDVLHHETPGHERLPEQ